ncbi:MAG: hypothetical protein PPP58_09620 [Natronomonas sp.]
MRRRHYLGALAAVAVAGCAEEERPIVGEGSDPDPEPEPEAEEPQPEAEAEPPAEDELEPEDETEPPEEEPTESERFAEERIDGGDERLQEALVAYADSGGAESFLDVRASVVGFRWVPVSRQVREANELFDRAANRANAEQRNRISRLRRVGAMITASARTQERLGESFEAFGDVVVAHQGDVVSPVAWRRLRERMDDVTTRLESLAAAGDPADAEASTRVSESELGAKIDQLNRDADAFRRLLDAREPFSEGHDRWIRAEGLYRRRSWISAEQRFDQSVTAFRTAVDRLDADPVGDRRLDSRYQTFRRMAEALADAGSEYGPSAAAYADRNPEAGDERRRAGRRILRNEDAVDGMPSVRRLESFEP